MKLKNFALSAVAASVLVWGGAAQATTYQFGENISFNGGPLFAHYADVTVTDADSDGNWEFSINAFGLDLLGSSAYIRLLGVDHGFGHQPTGVSSVSGPIGPLTFNSEGPGSPLGLLDYSFEFPTTGSGGGIQRLTDGEAVSWVANGMGQFADIPAGSFVMHVQSIGDDGRISEWYISPVPEPETYAMLLAGLGLIGFSLRRQKQ